MRICQPVFFIRSIVFHIDKDRFLKFYVDLLTRPVPVKFKEDDHGQDDGGED
jgi:hypothetical protein